MSKARDLSRGLLDQLNVDSNTLAVDVANNRVGVGKTDPATALDVLGTITADGLTVDGLTVLQGNLNGPATFTIDPAAHGDDTGTVIIAGNLQVDGLTTTINSTTLTVDDKNIVLASGAPNAAAADGAGITVDITGATNPSLVYGSSNDDWTFNKNLNVTGNIGVTGTVDGVDIATRDAVLTSTTTTAGAALPKAGGTMTGTLNVTQASTADTINLTRGTTAHNNMIKFVTGSTDKWIVGQRNDNTDHFRFYSYGTSSDVLSIQTDGKVGIGTDTPSNRLHIEGPASSHTALQIETTTSGFDPTVHFVSPHNSAGMYLDGTVDNKIKFYNGYGKGAAGREITFDNSGNVGIGTDSPATKLEISTTTAGLLTSGANRQGSVIRLTHNINHEAGYGGGDFLGGIEFESGDGSLGSGVRAAIRAEATDPYNTHSLKFYTATTNSTSIAARMTIDHNGNVGIGTNQPAELLHVTGVIRSDAAVNGLRATKGSSAYYGQLSVDYVSDKVNTYVDSIAGPSFSGQLFFRTSSNGAAAIEKLRLSSTEAVFNDAGLDTDFRVASDTNANMLRVDAGANRVVIGSSNVHSIGTASPPLQVAGNLTFQNYDLNSNVVTDTGISINQGSNGMAMQVLASNHSSTGTSTKAGQYFLKFYYSGNNAPVVTLVAGDNCVTFGVSVNNTLTVQMPAGGNSISFITNG